MLRVCRFTRVVRRLFPTLRLYLFISVWPALSFSRGSASCLYISLILPFLEISFDRRKKFAQPSLRYIFFFSSPFFSAEEGLEARRRKENNKSNINPIFLAWVRPLMLDRFSLPGTVSR